ncbi:MAG: MFS transporter [Planctomycetota bacterium]
MTAIFGQLPRTYWFLIAGMFVNRLGAFVLPFLSPYLKEHEGLSVPQISAVLLCWGVGTIVAGLVGGQLADRWGRKPTMLASLLVGAVVLGCFAVGHGVVQLAALAGVFGVVAELYRPAVAAAISDLVAPHQRARAFAHLTWAYNLGFAVSPLLAGWLIDHAGYEWLFVGDGTTMLLAALLIGARVPETRPAPAGGATGSISRAQRAVAVAFSDPRFVPLLVAALLLGSIMIQSLASLALVLRSDGIGTASFGRIIAVNGMLIVVLQPFLVPRLEHMGRYRVLPWAAVVFGVGFACHALVAASFGHVLVVCVWTCGEIALFPLCNAAVADLAPEHLRGRYQGAYWMAFASANVIGPPIGLGLLESLGSVGWASYVAAAGLLSALAFTVVGARIRAGAVADAE